MGHSPSSFFFFLNCLLAGCRDPRWMLGPKIFSVYPPPLSSKPGNSFLDCSAGLHGIHVGVLLCRYLEFSFLPSDKVRHHTCPCFSSSQNTLALPALWPHLLFCPFHLFFCIFRRSFRKSAETNRYNPSWLKSSPVCLSSELTLEMQY